MSIKKKVIKTKAKKTEKPEITETEEITEVQKENTEVQTEIEEIKETEEIIPTYPEEDLEKEDNKVENPKMRIKGFIVTIDILDLKKELDEENYDKWKTLKFSGLLVNFNNRDVYEKYTRVSSKDYKAITEIIKGLKGIEFIYG
jgi:hypothetical protein